MKAACWNGIGDVRVQDVPMPRIVNRRDAIVKVTLSAICGSDLHLYDGFIPGMKSGDILGHEFMGEVVEVGPDVTNLQPGDRVVVPFNIACGRCYFCSKDLWSLCDNSNPNPAVLQASYGHTLAGLFGYSHLFGGFAGGQAQFVRVPFADVGPLKVPAHLSDEQALFLSDIFPTGYQAAEQCDIKPGDTVAVWGAGPVGQFAIRSAILLGAQQVFAIDQTPERLAMARAADGVVGINFDESDVYEHLMDLTGGRGPDACIDAVGLEAHGHPIDAFYDRVKTATFMATDRVHVLRQAIRCCRKGGVLSVPGVYGGVADKFPIGALFGKAIQVRGGQTHVHRYLRPLLERIEAGQIDPTFVITHRIGIHDVPNAYELFKHHQDGCIKVVLDPQEERPLLARRAGATASTSTYTTGVTP